jgi:AAA+ ATPase superfamily predicted ATPase
MKKLVKEVGPWAEKERFWDRERELADLIQLLDEGANILITAPRRIGKTSLIREAGNRIKDRYCCLQLDLQKSH